VFCEVKNYLGCSLSGDRALLNKGDPGSADLGLLKAFFAAMQTPGVKA